MSRVTESTLPEPSFIGTCQPTDLAIMAGPDAVLLMKPSGDIFWRGRKIEGDDEFRTAMRDLSTALTSPSDFYTASQLQAAIAAEREACAEMLYELHAKQLDTMTEHNYYRIGAAAIRSRGDAP